MNHYHNPEERNEMRLVNHKTGAQVGINLDAMDLSCVADINWLLDTIRGFTGCKDCGAGGDDNG